MERRAFWAIQVLVLLIAALHWWVEYEGLLTRQSPFYLLPTTLYLIPAVYAAVAFGFRGAALTALWASVLVLVNLVLWHDGPERVGEVVQVAWISIAALFVGSRVDRERDARRDAEAREASRRASEERYRAIMDNVDEPIILLDAERNVVEANESAVRLLGQGLDELRGVPLPGSTGARIESRLEAPRSGRPSPGPMRLGQPPRWYDLVPMATRGVDGSESLQLLLRDVTASHEREQGLQSFTRQSLATREEERQRIARELHDGPLQSLVQLWRALDSLAEEMPEAQRAPVLAARATAENLAAELRRFSRDLRPSILDDLGVSAAIRAEAESLGQRASIGARVVVEGRAARLDQDVELALLRISQEAVRNIERHSDASEVVIRLLFERSRVRLTITDDGKGLDPVPSVSELLAENHLGLIGMQERARLVGGRFELTSTMGSGLTIDVSVPVREIPHR